MFAINNVCHREFGEPVIGAVAWKIDSDLTAVTINLSRLREKEGSATISTVCSQYCDIHVTCRSQPVH